MKTRNYMIDVAFELTTSYPEDKVPYEMILDALERRLNNLRQNKDREAFGFIDYYEIEDCN